MQATGNDYIYIDCFKKDISFLKNFKNLVIEMSDRNYGIGGDGVILICPSKLADAKMLMYNRDGSEGMMCGNGIRCVSKYVYENIAKKENLLIETKSGIKSVYINKNDIIVDMGYPVFEPSQIPVKLNSSFNHDVIINNKLFLINCVSIGNPHCVIFNDNIDLLNIEDIAIPIQNSNIFPNQCNVDIVQVLDVNKIKLRVYEKGSGETLSCGTGACASAVIGILSSRLNYNKEIEVNLKGGILYIRYTDKVYLRGPAETVFTGKYLIKKR